LKTLRSIRINDQQNTTLTRFIMPICDNILSPRNDFRQYSISIYKRNRLRAIEPSNLDDFFSWSKCKYVFRFHCLIDDFSIAANFYELLNFRHFLSHR